VVVFRSLLAAPTSRWPKLDLDRQNLVKRLRHERYAETQLRKGLCAPFRKD
jgi:hypothetical protein